MNIRPLSACTRLRAREHPTVSTPVTWEEVERALKKKDANLLVFEAKQVVERFEKMGDLFAPVLDLKQRLPDLKGVSASGVEEAEPTISIAAQAEDEPDDDRTARCEESREAAAGAQQGTQGIIPSAANSYFESLPCRNCSPGLRDGLTRVGSPTSIQPSSRRRSFSATTPRSSTPSR